MSSTGHFGLAPTIRRVVRFQPWTTRLRRHGNCTPELFEEADTEDGKGAKNAFDTAKHQRLDAPLDNRFAAARTLNETDHNN